MELTSTSNLLPPLSLATIFPQMLVYVTERARVWVRLLYLIVTALISDESSCAMVRIRSDRGALAAAGAPGVVR